MVLVYAKKHTGLSSLDWDEAVEEALCFGWIDSKRWRLDETFFLQIFTPRKPKSRWSGLNKKRVVALTEAGLMAPAGQAAIDQAKRTGTWSAHDQVDAMVMPPDLKKALAKNAGSGREVQDAHPGPPEAVSVLHERRKEGRNAPEAHRAHPEDAGAWRASALRGSRVFRPAADRIFRRGRPSGLPAACEYLLESAMAGRECYHCKQWV